MDLYRGLSDERDWPVFSVPLSSGHTIHVVYRDLEDGRGVAGIPTETPAMPSLCPGVAFWRSATR